MSYNVKWRKNCIEVAASAGFNNERIINWLSQLLSKLFFSTNAAMKIIGRQVDRAVMREVLIMDDSELKSAVLDWAEYERNAVVSGYEKSVIEMLMEAEDEILGFLSLEETVVFSYQGYFVLQRMFADDDVGEVIDALIEKDDPELIQAFVTDYVEKHYDYSILGATKH